MFVSDNAIDVAVSWQVRGELVPAKLVVRPLFAGCQPRGYRDTGFQYQPDEQGRGLIWLPNVTGPKIIADANGCYVDEPIRMTTSVDHNHRDSSVVAPGRFEFQLKARPSVLILSSDELNSPGQQFVGRFLTNLMRLAANPGTIKIGAPAEHLLAA